MRGWGSRDARAARSADSVRRNTVHRRLAAQSDVAETFRGV